MSSNITVYNAYQKRQLLDAADVFWCDLKYVKHNSRSITYRLSHKNKGNFLNCRQYYYMKIQGRI